MMGNVKHCGCFLPLIRDKFKSSGGTVVQHLTRNPKIEGLNPSGKGREPLEL
jgi:hypothetical protein